MIAKLDPVENLESKSTFYQKLTPEARRKLNRAIVDRCQPTYRACYDHYHLADRGVGFFAFYRYARNLRHQATITDLAESQGEQNTDPITLNDAVTRLLAYRLIEAGDDETIDSHVLLRLMRAYHLSVHTRKLLRDDLDRKGDEDRALRKKEADEMIKLARAHAALFRQQLKQQLIERKNGLPDPDDDDSGFSISKLYEQRFGVSDDDDDDDEPDRSCEHPLSHARPQESVPASSSNSQSPDQPREEASAQSSAATPDDPDLDTSRESRDPPDVAPRVNAVLDTIKQGWARRNAEMLARAKPGSLHEKIARIYANPESTEPDS